MEQENEGRKRRALVERIGMAVGTTVLSGVVKALVDALLRRGC